MNISRAVHYQQPREAAPAALGAAAVSCCSDLSSVLLREELMGMQGAGTAQHHARECFLLCKPHISLLSSALLVVSPIPPASPSTAGV